MAKPVWPLRGANHQWDADDLDRFPIVAEAAREGVTLTDMWYGELPTAPSRVDDSYEGGARAIDQFRMTVPGMNVMRQLFNQWHLQDPAKGFHDAKSNGFIDRWVETGGSLLWVLMDGPSQRAYGDEPGKGKFWTSYPDPDRIKADPEGTFEHVMEKIHASQVASWTALCTYLKEHPEVLAQSVGFELINEAETYAQAGDRTGDQMRAHTRYVQHCIALVDLIDRMLPGHGLDIYVGGWNYSAKINELHRNRLPEFEDKSSYEALSDHIGKDRFVWSLHMYPSWMSQQPVDMAAWEDGLRDAAGDAMDAGVRIAITEFNSQNSRADDLSYSGNGADRKDFMMSRATQVWRDNNISLFWWPLATWAMGAVIDARGEENGLKNYHQNSLYSFINVMADGGDNPEWFTGPASGPRQAHFVPADRGTKNEKNDPDYCDKLEDGSSLDDVRGFALGFGGAGDAVVTPAENANNFLYGGTGRNVLYGSEGTDDYLSLGKGGGVARVYGGLNYVNTNGGENLIYGGTGRTQVSCYWGVNTIVCDPTARTIIIGWQPDRGDRLSFKGGHISGQTTEDTGHETDLIVTFREGGSLRLINGSAHADRLGEYNLDETAGWYGPGWSEPADLASDPPAQ